MANYGTKSSEVLKTTHPDLILLFTEVIKEYDNMILYGFRDKTLQLELYKKGRELINGVWTITDCSKVVTYKDGINKMSKHNYRPSQAIDVIPWPINWKDIKRMHVFAGYVLGIANQMKKAGLITYDIRWGGDWDRDTEVLDETFMDLVHFEIVD